MVLRSGFDDKVTRIHTSAHALVLKRLNIFHSPSGVEDEIGLDISFLAGWNVKLDAHN